MFFNIHLTERLQVFWLSFDRRPDMVSERKLLLVLLRRESTMLSLREPVVHRCQRTVTDVSQFLPCYIPVF